MRSYFIALLLFAACSPVSPPAPDLAGPQLRDAAATADMAADPPRLVSVTPTTVNSRAAAAVDVAITVTGYKAAFDQNTSSVWDFGAACPIKTYTYGSLDADHAKIGLQLAAGFPSGTCDLNHRSLTLPAAFKIVQLP